MRFKFPRPVQIILAGTFINRLGSFTITFLAANLTHARHAPVEFAGLVLAVFGVGCVLAAPVGGHLADVLGRKITMVASLIFNAFCVFAIAKVQSHALILASAFGLGFGGGLYRPAASAAISDDVLPSELSEAHRAYHWVFNLACAIGAALGGYLASESFTLLGAVDALTSLLYALVTLIWLDEKKGLRASRKSFNLHKPFLDHVFCLYFAITLLWSLVFGQLESTYAVDLLSRGISSKEFGFIFTFNGALIVLLQPLVSKYIDRARPAYVLTLSSVFVGVGFGLTGIVSGYAQILGAVSIWTIGEIISSGVLMAVATQLAPVRLRGSYTGAIMLTFSLSRFAAPLIGTFLLGQFGRSVLWAACFIGGLIAAFGYYRTADLVEGRTRNQTSDAEFAGSSQAS